MLTNENKTITLIKDFTDGVQRQNFLMDADLNLFTGNQYLVRGFKKVMIDILKGNYELSDIEKTRKVNAKDESDDSADNILTLESKRDTFRDNTAIIIFSDRITLNNDKKVEFTFSDNSGAEIENNLTNVYYKAYKMIFKSLRYSDSFKDLKYDDYIDALLVVITSLDYDYLILIDESDDNKALKPKLVELILILKHSIIDVLPKDYVSQANTPFRIHDNKVILVQNDLISSIEDVLGNNPLNLSTSQFEL